LPFANLSGDPDQDYFVDGVTESLTTDLSRINGSLVIGRHTAFTYKGKAVDLKRIGLELNVRYVLEGSVQRSGKRLRVNAQLIDAETGSHLWAERFDKPVADLFDMQDEIVSRLANTLNAQLIAIEARRAERSLHPSSMDLYFQGRAWLNKGLVPEYITQARHFRACPDARSRQHRCACRLGGYRSITWQRLYDRQSGSAPRGVGSGIDQCSVPRSKSCLGSLELGESPN
jgi:TolB-like protein